MDKERLPWRSFACADDILATWNSPGTPTYYILDPRGMIRHKWIGYPGEKELDTALEKLIQAAEGDANKPAK